MASTPVLFFLFSVFAGLSGTVAQTSYFPDTQNVYHLFTRQNPSVSQPMLFGFPTLIGSNFDPTRRTAVLIHTWDTNALSPFNVALVPAILASIDVNLIAVDWSAGAVTSDPNVLISHNVPLCAEGVARFLAWLNQQTGATLDQYHVVGFEIGAHVGGRVGRNLNGQIDIITALNPSRYGFNETNTFLSTDAVYTEAIHTAVFGSGVMQPVAHTDFYPNGGLFQPGCEIVDWDCSRDMSYLFFAESLISGGFTGTRCDVDIDADIVAPVTCEYDTEVTLPMGGLTDKAGSFGVYYVPVNAQSPYSQG